MDNQPTVIAPVQSFKNRRGWLIAFGIFQLLIAVVMFLFAALTLFIPTAEIAKSQPAGSPQVSFAVVSVFYSAIGAVFATLGIGSILSKNWARIGTLIVCWFWLVIGFVSLAFAAILMPAILKNASRTQQNLPSNFETVVLVTSVLIIGIFFVILPGIFLIFYHGKNVQATCLAGSEMVQSKRPVLMTVLIFLFSFSLLSIPFAIFSNYPVMLFGHLIWGWPGKIFFLISISAEIFAMWGFIRLDIRGWWTALLTSIFWLSSTTVSFTSGHLIDTYRQMGMTEEQLAIIKTPHFLTGMIVFLVCFIAARISAIAYSKRYFQQTSAS